MTPQGRSIVFLDQFGDIGGGQRVLLDLARFAKEKGWSVTVLCPQGPLIDALRSADISAFPLSLPPVRDGAKGIFSYLRMFFRSRTIANEYRHLAEKSDVLVVNGLRTLGIARIWLKKFHKPVVLYLHGVYRGFQRSLILSFLRHDRSAAVAPSPIAASPFASCRNVSVIPNWVSEEFFAETADPALLRSSLGIIDDLPLILIPGRYSPNKGQLIALEASELLKDIPCHFVFAGAALFEKRSEEIERLLRSASERAPGRIFLTHWKRSLPGLFDGADLVLVPSVWNEPFGLTAIEAMARSRPLIVSDRGMLPHVAENGRFAEVCPPDASSLAQAIRSYLGNREAWRTRAESAHLHVLRSYGPANREKVLELFRGMIE